MDKIRILKACNWSINYKKETFIKGDTPEISDSVVPKVVAKLMVESGYAEYVVKESPKPKKVTKETLVQENKSFTDIPENKKLPKIKKKKKIDG